MENFNKQLLLNTLATNGYITVNKKLIKVFGLNEAVILGELLSEYLYWQENNLLVNDAFYSTQDNLEENTGLNSYFQRKAIASLKDFGIVKIEKTGMPAKNYYKINFAKLADFLTTSRLTSEGQDVQPVNLNNNKESNKNILSNDNINKKKNLFEKGKDIIYAFTEDIKLQELLIEWFELQLEMYRNEGKQFYLTTLKNRLNKLKQFKKDEWKTVVQYAMEKQWKSFYPVPTERKYNADVISQTYTKNELDVLKTLEERRKLNGLKTKF